MNQQEQPEYRVYQVWRLDDNGNEFLVETFDDRNSAEERAAGLAASGHKQVYWVTESAIQRVG